MTDIKKGDKFGEWTVIDNSEKPYHVKCKCSCGKIKNISKSSLRLGKSKSCGHLRTEKLISKRFDSTDKKILGKKFDRLTPIKRVNSSGRAEYFCLCDCGNEVIVKGGYLLSGKTNSCGCLKIETSKENIDKIKELGFEKNKKAFVEGTNLNSLTQKKSKNNSSGYKGVSKMKSGKYRAYINFERKQKHLGTFDTLEEAVLARKKAEKKYFEPILKKYKNKI